MDVENCCIYSRLDQITCIVAIRNVAPLSSTARDVELAAVRNALAVDLPSYLSGETEEADGRSS